MKTHYPKTRIGIVTLIFTLAFLVFFVRLVFVQVVRGEQLRQKGKRQYQESIEIRADRGEIFDCRGYKVAVNSSLKSHFAYPLNKQDVAAAYTKMAGVFGISQSTLKRKHKLTPKKFRWIKRRLTANEIARFEKDSRNCGLYLREEPSRNYPYENIGRGILGFVDLDNCGKAGIELQMNEKLTGQNGRSLIQKDGLGSEFLIQEIPLSQARSGQSLVLTVDWNKQQIVEEELSKAVREHNAKGGMAVFLNPHTGAILAAADFCIDDPQPEKPMKLEAVAAIFEPGSVFKLVTAAAALENGDVLPSDTFFAEDGRWKLGRDVLRDDHKFGWMTFREAFENSSNIAMGKIANQVGADKVMAMAGRFGFGQKTRCGLNGESRGIMKRPRRWSQFTTATFAIGHGISSTAIQVAQAFAVVASGGFFNQPYLVEGCINDEGKIIERHHPRPIRVLSDDVILILDSFLRGVVENGTGSMISNAPFLIAGKTGTAEKPNLESGGYHKNRFMASFAGYFPADSPLVAGIVVIDEPEPIHYGGYTAGPAFRDIAIKFGAMDNYKQALREDDNKKAEDYIFAGEMPGNSTLPLIDLAGLSRRQVEEKLCELSLEPVFSGQGNKVICTYPAVGSRVELGETIRCIMDRGSDSKFAIPDLTGLSAREAIAVLAQYRLPYQCQGYGTVVRQVPVAGKMMSAEKELKLFMERRKGV